MGIPKPVEHNIIQMYANFDLNITTQGKRPDQEKTSNQICKPYHHSQKEQLEVT